MRKPSIKEFKSLFPYLARYRSRYVCGFICLITVDVAQMVIPQFIRQAVDLISAGQFRFADVLAPACAMVGVMAVIAAGRFLWRYFIHGASRRIEAELRAHLFDHLLSLSYDFYQKNKIGDLMARATNDLNAVRESIGMGLVALIDGTVMAVSILVIIFVQDPHTAALAVIPLPFVTLLILFFGSAVGKRFLKAHETYSAMSDTVQETFMGIRVLKSFVKEWWFIKKFADTNDDYRDANMALVKLYGVFFPFITFLSGLTSLIVLFIGGLRVIEGLITPGDMVALFRYLQMLIWPLMGAGFVVNMIQRGAASLGRVNGILETKPSIASPPPEEKRFEKATLSSAKKEETEIVIKNMSFTYPEGAAALSDITLSLRRGELLGILGRTGSGKSTLIKAITRMIAPPPQTVFVKGVAVEDWDVPALRSCFGVTPQDSYLFSDSIKNNIFYGLTRPDFFKNSFATSIEISHSPTEIFHAPTEISHSPIEVSHAPTEVSHAPIELSHSSTKVSHSPTEISYSPKELSHTPTEVPYTPTKDEDAPAKVEDTVTKKLHTAAEMPSIPVETPATPPEITHLKNSDFFVLAKAADLAALDSDLKTFAEGWDTVIGERGLTLSGGQKQRVAIARALIGAPDILILDDALSAVDAETEKRILTALLEERQGKTTIIISHRVSTLNHADNIAVLDKGRITEYGAPAELVAAGGFYAKTAALQQLNQKEVLDRAD